MWQMTKIGFYSAVQHRDDPDLLMIRARSRQDLVNVHEFASQLDVELGAIVESTAHADYPYRLTCTKLAWATVTGALIGDIDYENFKSQVAMTNLDRAHTYGRVWQALLQVEREELAGVYGTRR